MFEGFDFGDVIEIRIRSYTAAAGGSAQLVAIELDVYHANVDEPEVQAVDYHGDGPTWQALRPQCGRSTGCSVGGGEAASP